MEIESEEYKPRTISSLSGVVLPLLTEIVIVIVEKARDRSYSVCECECEPNGS